MNKNEIGKVVMRMVLGLIFLVHGIAKFQDGMNATSGFFDTIGLPGMSAYLVTTIEIIGGIAIIIGLGTRIFALLFASIMVVAIITVKFSAGFIGGYELDLALLAMSVYFILEKPMILSVDNLIFGTEKG